MAKRLNDDGNKLPVNTENLRLTADTPGGPLGWVDVKELMKHVLEHGEGLVVHYTGDGYAQVLSMAFEELPGQTYLLLSARVIEDASGRKQVEVNLGGGNECLNLEAYKVFIGDGHFSFIRTGPVDEEDYSKGANVEVDLRQEEGHVGRFLYNGREVAVKDDLPEGITDLGNMTDDEAFDTKTTPGFYKYTFGTPSKDGYLVVTTDNNIVQEGGGASALYQIRFEGLNILYRSLATSGSWDASFKKMDLNTTIGGKEGTGGQREAIVSSNYKLWQFADPGFYRFQPIVFERFTDIPSEITSISGSRNYALLVLGTNFTAADYPNSNTVSQILMDFPSVSGGSSTYEPTMWVRIVNTTDGNPGSYGTWRKIGGGSSVEVVQSAGKSTTSVMSQKAVTNTIGNLSSDVMRDEGLYEDVDTLGETASRTSTNGEQVSYINHRIEEYAVGADDPSIFTYDEQVHTLKLAQFTVHPQEGDLSFIADNYRGVLLDPTWSYVNFICSNEPRYFSARIGGGKCVLVDTNGDTSGDHYIQLFAEAAYSASSGGIDVTIFAEYKLSGGGEGNNPLYINGNLPGYLRIWIV